MENIPEKIWLNLGEEVPDDTDFHDLSEVTWSENKVFDKDVEYVRKSEWISVQERFPEDCELVLVFLDSSRFTGYYDGNDEMWYIDGIGSYEPTEISHWCPLPAIPKLND